MNRFRTQLAGALSAVLIAASASIAGARPAQLKPDPKTVAKLARLLEQSGYTYRKAADNVWVANLKGNSLTEIPVLVTSNEDIVIIGVIVAEKKTMRMGPDLMRILLKLPHNLDQVKIGLDNDDDLFVRTEVHARLVDLEEFKSDVTQVAAASDEVHAAIKAYRVQ